MSRQQLSLHALSYYSTHGSLTDPGKHQPLLAGLPGDPIALAGVVQGLLVHPLNIQLYHIQLSPIQREEVQLRSVEQMLARIRHIEHEPLTSPREYGQRLVGNCRDYALLYTSFLQSKGIPARVRVGFAAYFGPDLYYDHWVTEYWDGDRWVLADPQIDDRQREAFEITFDPLDMQYDRHFYLAGRAWELSRRNEMRSDKFGFNQRWNGMSYIRGNLLHDLGALNKVELLPWDMWSDFIRKEHRDLGVDERALLDRLAGWVQAPAAHLDELRTLWAELPHGEVVRSRLRMLGLVGEAHFVDGDGLTPGGAEQLAALRKVAPEYVPFAVPDELFEKRALESLPGGPGDIVIRGARQHNLKDITVTIPRHKFVVVTGVSGSGKSSLAFDTLYAEGQRRYVESLSSYARQFLNQMEKPKVDQITGLSPAIAIEQKSVSKNPRSTVGTVTEVMDYLRVLYARVGVPHCPQCGRGVLPQTAQQITTQLAALPAGSRFQLLAPVVRGRKGTHSDVLAAARQEGFTRARIDGKVVNLGSATPNLAKTKRHSIELIVDRLQTPPEANGDFRQRLTDSVETALRAGNGLVTVDLGEQEITLSEHNACPDCDISFPPLSPQMFSFNSPAGMCPECNGLGVKLQLDPERIVPHPEHSLLDGASPWYGNLRKKQESSWTVNVLHTIAEFYGVDLELPWKELPEHFRHVLFYGSGEEKIFFRHDGNAGSWESNQPTRGIIYHLNRLFRQTKSEYRRRWYMQFMSELPCPMCHGERLCAESRFVTLGGLRIPEVGEMSIAEAHAWVSNLHRHFSEEQVDIAGELLKEIRERLQFMLNVGLHYLTLNRAAPSLSGGESQRIRLASQLGCGLVGVSYILDEPSIGLHSRDHRALLDTLLRLRDMGNTVIVIEHDADTMRAADWLIDLGPGPGRLGGDLVAAGTPDEVLADTHSLTGEYLSGKRQVVSPNGHTRRTPGGWLTVRGARLHNLKRIDARFPLGVLCCVTGVSGSGKSSLVSSTLHPALSHALHGAQTAPGPHDRIDGLEQVDKVIHITQDPIGRTPRSNPATYVKVFDEVRKVFAMTPEAKARGYRPDRFSFNVKGGRCEDCLGYGQKKVEMHFLPDVWVTCKSCDGRRFNRATLEIEYKGRNIADVLDLDIQDALALFAYHPAIARVLQTLHDVGLDYLKMGQSALTLSGGEAQRVKLAKELSRASTGRTVYILDEPTTGLHFADIQKLLDVLHQLVDAGNTVIVIEHNLDVIRSADWIVDLGPEGGAAGGEIIAEGPPESLAAVEHSYTGQSLRSMLR